MKKLELIGKRVIIRSAEAGVFYGTLLSKENTPSGCEVELGDCIRIWKWSGACSVSQLAVDGTADPKECRFAVRVKEMVIIGVMEIIPCTEKACKSIESVETWKC